MRIRVSADEKLRRAVTAYLKHTDDHGNGFRCLYCRNFRTRMVEALTAAIEGSDR